MCRGSAAMVRAVVPGPHPDPSPVRGRGATGQRNPQQLRLLQILQDRLQHRMEIAFNLLVVNAQHTIAQRHDDICSFLVIDSLIYMPMDRSINFDDQVLLITAEVGDK